MRRRRAAKYAAAVLSRSSKRERAAPGQGSIREPQMRGGGTVWGTAQAQLSPRSTAEDAAEGGLLCIELDRARNEQLCVLEGLALDGPKNRADG